MTIALVAAELFTGNQHAALTFLMGHGYIKPLSKRRFNPRLHQIPETLRQTCLFALSKIHQQTNRHNIHIVDTCPIPVCRNIRIASRNCIIKRCKIYQDEAFRGYCASKKEYFYGLKLCLIITESGDPVEVLHAPGATPDIAALRAMDLNLPDGCTLIGDGGFLDRLFEKALREEAGINLIVPRRKNMTDQLDGCTAYLSQRLRKQVENTFS